MLLDKHMKLMGCRNNYYKQLYLLFTPGNFVSHNHKYVRGRYGSIRWLCIHGTSAALYVYSQEGNVIL